ncbi:MAG: hypothetical protein ACK5IP_10685 [Paracoccus sp. (in: a-proteobacteria)]
MYLNRTTQTIASSFRLYGERCSGTNFLRALVERNLPGLMFGNDYNFEKHDFVNPAHVRETEVGLVIIRNALDWLTSLHRNPHQVGAWHQSLDFSGFLRHEWSSVFNGNLINDQERLDIRDQELLLDRHPVTGARIGNVVQLRNLKVQSQLKVRHLYPKWMIVRYETVRDAPNLVVHNLARLTGHKPPKVLQGVEQDMSMPSGANRRHLPYAAYTPEDLDFVARNLDLQQEQALGFRYPALTRDGASVPEILPA